MCKNVFVHVYTIIQFSILENLQLIYLKNEIKNQLYRHTCLGVTPDFTNTCSFIKIF